MRATGIVDFWAMVRPGRSLIHDIAIGIDERSSSAFGPPTTGLALGFAARVPSAADSERLEVHPGSMTLEERTKSQAMYLGHQRSIWIKNRATGNGHDSDLNWEKALLRAGLRVQAMQKPNVAGQKISVREKHGGRRVWQALDCNAIASDQTLEQLAQIVHCDGSVFSILR